MRKGGVKTGGWKRGKKKGERKKRDEEKFLRVQFFALLRPLPGGSRGLTTRGGVY